MKQFQPNSEAENTLRHENSPITSNNKKLSPTPVAATNYTPTSEKHSAPPIIKTLKAELLTTINGVETFTPCIVNSREVHLFGIYLRMKIMSIVCYL